MKHWASGQKSIAARLGVRQRIENIAMQNVLFDNHGHKVETSVECRALEALALVNVELILEGEQSYCDAVLQARREAYTVLAIMRQRKVGLSDLTLMEIDDAVPGFARAAETLSPGEAYSPVR